MVKKAEQNTLSDSKGMTFEQRTIVDDNLLPSADELARLNEVSKDIIPWIMARTEKEQDARIKFNEDRMRLSENDLNFAHRYNMTALIMAFLIVIAFLSASFYLIISGKELIGSIFAGGTIVGIVSYFLNSNNRRKKQ